MPVSPMALNKGLLLTIRGLLPALNEQEQKVGQYILDHPDDVVHLAMSNLAQRCSASDATIFRFCKKVGTGGYQDLKIRLAQELGAAPATTYAEIGTRDDAVSAAQKVIAADVKALEDTLSMLDLAALERAVAALLGARRVEIYGSGGAAIAALELQYKLIRVGVHSVAYTDAEMQIISAVLLTPADVAVGISHSGAAREVLHALQLAKQAGSTVIAMTNHPASPMAVIADISLCTAAQEALAHGYPLGARVAQVALIDVLYACAMLRRRGDAERSAARFPGALTHTEPP